MKDIFTYLLDFSVMTSAAILLAILLRPLLKKGPSFIRCILWALVFLRLLVPVGVAELPILERDTMVPPLFEETVSVPAGDVIGESVQTPTGQAPDVQTPTGQEPVVQNPALQSPASGGSAPVTDQNLPQTSQTENIPPVQTETGIDLLFIFSVVWAAGAVVMLGYMLTSNLLLRYRVRNAIVYDSKIRVIDRDCSPFVFGFFRPIIYIPASVNKADWAHIIAHETSHIKRLDHLLKPFAFFVLCFYWYNPLVWAAYILLGKDIEYACDEKTVKRMENSDRKAYSLALLAVSQGENIVFAPPLSFGKVSVKERVKRVMTKRIPVWAVCIAIVICVALSFLTVFTLAAANSNDGSDGNDSLDSADNGDTSSEGEGPVGLPVFSVAYASPAELAGDSLFYDEQGYELIRVSADREVKGFKFIEVLYDDDANPYAGKALYEVASLSPDTPFYAQTDIPEGLGDRGISFEDGNGQTVSYRMMYDSYGNEMTDNSLSLEVIPNHPAEANAGTYLLPLFIKKNPYTLYMEYEDNALTILSDGDFYYRYTWDDKGRLTGEEFPWCHFVYEYDTDGRLALETQIDGYGKTFMRTEYTYNDVGECVDAKVTVDPERRSGRQEHLYDASGRLVTEIQYEDETNEAWRLQYSYDENGNLLQRIRSGAYGDERILYEYDESGKRIKETGVDAWGNLQQYGVYEYDENGLCRWKETVLQGIDAVTTSELIGTVEVTLSEEAYKTVLRLLLEHY